MTVMELVEALERDGHHCKRGADGQPRTWTEPGRGAMLIVNRTAMLASEAELLLRPSAVVKGRNTKPDGL